MQRVFIIILGLVMSLLTISSRSMAINKKSTDGYSAIQIEESCVYGVPRGSSILASINGHVLTVTFLENLGNVQVEVTTASGGTVDLTDIWTPNSYIANITNTGDYVVTITLGNGDEYYGEFEVTD